jgi:membrane fusion protein, multidrug efflux system
MNPPAPSQNLSGRRLTWPAVALAALVMLGVGYTTRSAFAQAGPPPVTVAKPVLRDIVEDDEFIGRFEAVDEVQIRARVGGYLDTVHFTDGALVKKGDLLFTIDQRPFALALTQARAQLDAASTRLRYARAQLARAEALSRNGNIPTSTLDERRSESLAAQADTQGAEAAVSRAEIDMEFTEIRAPFDGRIDRRYISAGNLVQADQTILTSIVSVDPIDFYFDVDEREFLAYARDARSRKEILQQGAGGLSVSIRLADSVSEVVHGTLDFGENRLDKATGTMRLRARVPNPDLILQPGLFGRVNVPGSLPHAAVLVPDEAIGADQDRRIVFVVDEAGSVSAKPVRTGPRIYGYRVIRSGLDGTETLVVNGLMRVRPGGKVTPTLITLPADRSAPEGAQ